jgi:hypothetical protein
MAFTTDTITFTVGSYRYGMPLKTFQQCMILGYNFQRSGIYKDFKGRVHGK